MRHATCGMRVVDVVSAVRAHLLPRLRESTFPPAPRCQAEACRLGYPEPTRASSLRSTSSIYAQGICTPWVPSPSSLLGATPEEGPRSELKILAPADPRFKSRVAPGLCARHDAHCRQTRDLLLYGSLHVHECQSFELGFMTQR